MKFRARARQQPKRIAHRHQQRQNQKNGSLLWASNAAFPSSAGAVRLEIRVLGSDGALVQRGTAGVLISRAPAKA